jgi:hypothetical protein
VVAAVAFSACGGATKTASPPTTNQPAPTTAATTAATTSTAAAAALNSCTLLPQAKAEQLMGTKLQAGVHQATADVDTCLYAGDPSGPTAQVQLFLGAGAKKYYDDESVTLQHQFTDVAGIGDEAHEEDFALFFRKGATWVALAVTSLDDWTIFKPRVEALAKDIAAQV